MKIAILGAGNVAFANACFCSNAGHDVHVWSSFAQERETLARAGAIEFDGYMAGRARITAASDVAACISGAEVVMIAAPAFAHRSLMAAAAPHLTATQHVMVHPVTGLSSLLLSRMLKERGVRPLIIDLSTSLFATRKTGPSAVHLFSIKNLIELAAIPHERGAEALARLESIYGKRFMVEPNALAISLNNHNPVYHVPPMLCNLSRAERRERWIIWENITPGIARFVKLVDDERLALVRHFGTTEVSVDQYFKQSYGVDGANLVEIFQAVTDKLKGPLGPQELHHRFILEDVPYAMVFFSALGRAAGVPTPITDHLIAITSAIYERDFTAEGHTLEALGLAGLDSRALLKMTQTGF